MNTSAIHNMVYRAKFLGLGFLALRHHRFFLLFFLGFSTVGLRHVASSCSAAPLPREFSATSSSSRRHTPSRSPAVVRRPPRLDPLSCSDRAAAAVAQGLLLPGRHRRGLLRLGHRRRLLHLTSLRSTPSDSCEPPPQLPLGLIRS
jgi:hypothetical protein